MLNSLQALSHGTLRAPYALSHIRRMDLVAKNIDFLVRKLKAKTVNKLAALIKMQQPTLSRIYNNRTLEPRSSTLKPLADAAGVTPMEFMTLDLEEIDRQKALTDDRGTVQVWQNAADLEPDENRLWLDSFDYQVSAGTGILSWEVREKAKLPFSMSFFHQKRANPRDCKLIVVRGPSMQPYLQDHDVAMIDLSQTSIYDGEIYAVYYDDESFVKQIFKMPGGGITLHSYNPTYKDIVLEREQLEFVKIIGRVIYRSG